MISMFTFASRAIVPIETRAHSQSHGTHLRIGAEQQARPLILPEMAKFFLFWMREWLELHARQVWSRLHLRKIQNLSPFFSRFLLYLVQKYFLLLQTTNSCITGMAYVCLIAGKDMSTVLGLTTGPAVQESELSRENDANDAATPTMLPLRNLW